jgi:hypothetical protein
MATAEAQKLAAPTRSWEPPVALPLALFAAVALLASWLGRSIFPAMVGAATGLAPWIERTQRVAGLLSQLVAAGGVAFSLRAVALTFGRTWLGIGYRMVVIPAATAAAVLIMAATGRVLEEDLNSVLVVAAITTAAASASVAVVAPATRALGFALALTALGGALDFAGIHLSQSAIDHVSPVTYRAATILTTLGFAVEVLLVSMAFGWLAARRSGRAIVLSLLSVVLVFAWGIALRGAARPGASAWLVVVARAVTSLLRAPSPLVPSAARLVLEAASSVGAVAALAAARRAPLAPLLALCLIARGALDIPLPALMLVVAALAVPASVTSALRQRAS